MRMENLTKPLYEAPIDDYALIGKWGDQERSHSFADPRDRRAVQNPKAIEKVRKKFGKLETNLNFYFVNLPGLRKFSETGVMTPEELSEQMPNAWKLIKQRQHEKGTDDSDAVNVIFVTNIGANKIPFTAWIMAHRIGHAINSSGTIRKGEQSYYFWREAQQQIEQTTKEILSEVYGWSPGVRYFWSDPVLAKFFQSIGTMKSARDKNFGGRPYEFVYELFAQYITTGSIRFNNIPRSFGIRGKSNYVMKDPTEDVEFGEMLLNRGLAEILPDYFDASINYLEGHYLVM